MKLITDIIVMKILSHLNFIDSIIIDDMNTENESEEDGTMKALNVSRREKKDYPQEFKLEKTQSDVQTLLPIHAYNRLWE